MSWATPHIQKLKAGETVKFRPRGNSMKGRIESGALVTVEPVTDSTEIVKNDVVLCKVNGKPYLHLVIACGSDGRYLIGNMHGFQNGWTSRNNIYGKLIRVEE